AVPPLRIQYKDYATWQLAQLQDDAYHQHRSYWLKQLEGPLPLFELAAGKPRPAVKTHHGAGIRKPLGRELVDGMRALTKAQGATLFMGLLAAVKALLYRYTGQEDLIVGTPVAGREHVDLEDQIGLYLNTLGLRTRYHGADTYQELLAKVKAVTLGAYAHQQYPFDALVDDLGLRRDISRSALFDVMVVLQDAGLDLTGEYRNPDGLQISRYEGWDENRVSKFDLVFNFLPDGEGLYADIAYNCDLYDREVIQRLGDHLESMLGAILAHPSVPIAVLSYLSEAEKQQLTDGFNQTAAEYPRDKTVVALFEQQVRQTPAHPALVSGEGVLRYEALNQQANQLGQYLRKHYGIKPDDLVAIRLERSPSLVIAVLGVLKSGAAYVPIDPAYPRERVDFILSDGKCKLLLDETWLAQFEAVRAGYDPDDLPPVNTPRDLAYLIYTSGSAGQPKGVLVEHTSLVNLCYWHTRTFAVTGQDCATLYAGVAFDASVWELFPYLLSGACLHIVPESIRLDARELASYYDAHQVTVSFLPTQMAEQFMETENHSLRVLLTGGEKLNAFARNRYQLVNNYGPTENTVVATSYRVDAFHPNIAIGRPVSNTQLYVLDPQQQLVPVGVAGEICIAGDGLGRGYLNQPELTATKFVPHPFRPGERLYK
ncbi:MAG TPA: amino acid adenylation domain-containing protein, partial [Cytophagales bacterium]